MPFRMKDMKTIYDGYEKFKESKNYIEYDDFLNMVHEIFRTRPDILERYRNRYHYILSDEYQDVSMNQAILIDYLGVWNNNFVVGDMLQSIYAFRGGNSGYLANFKKGWENVTIINLNMNYRCTANIVRTANTFASCIPYSRHETYKPSVASHKEGKTPEYTRYKTAKEEGDGISNKILQLVNEGNRYSDFAILARTNAQLQKISTVFRGHNIPLEIVDGVLFTELSEVKLIMAYLKLASDINDDGSFEHLYNKPNRWLSKKFLEDVKNVASKRKQPLFLAMADAGKNEWKYKKGIEEIKNTIQTLKTRKFHNAAEMVAYLRHSLKIDEFVTKGRVGDDGISEQIDNLNAFQDICKDFKTIPELLAYLDRFETGIRKDDSESKIKLLTIHKAKGLEFPIVFIVGCSDGLLPHIRNIDLDSEKNLMYVAITRAEKELYFTSVQMYNDKNLPESPFMKTIKGTVKTIFEKSS
jgi:DNA helicase-2/ATP-dependent DNA helicase PcrA